MIARNSSVFIRDLASIVWARQAARCRRFLPQKTSEQQTCVRIRNADEIRALACRRPDTSFARSVLRYASASAQSLSRFSIVRAAARRPAAWRTADECRQANTKSYRKLDTAALQAGAKYLLISRCSWST
jgi:hypothetical protein